MRLNEKCIINNLIKMKKYNIWNKKGFHKRIWRKGFRNANLGPDKYGMFRTKDINLMTINEVYIGGIYGLNTRTIAQWEDSKEEPYDSTQTCYDIVLCAYKRLLKSNIIALADNAKLLVAEYQQNNYKLWYSYKILF